MDKAIEQLSKQAKSMGADGIVGVTFIFSKKANGTPQVSAYGTAIVFTGTDSEE